MRVETERLSCLEEGEGRLRDVGYESRVFGESSQETMESGLLADEHPGTPVDWY